MTNTEFEIGGLCHLALVCKDMEETVDFYTNVLGMPLRKTIAIPGGGQHFFFECGPKEYVAFFWFPDAPEAAPGIASSPAIPGIGDISTAHGSMNHVAFKVPADKFDEYVEKLHNKGVKTGPVLNHDNSPYTVSATVTDDVYIRSIYFMDPNGILLEFASWLKELGPEDVNLAPVRADGTLSPHGVPGREVASV